MVSDRYLANYEVILEQYSNYLNQKKLQKKASKHLDC